MGEYVIKNKINKRIVEIDIKIKKKNFIFYY
jgi:hypothetical protein